MKAAARAELNNYNQTNHTTSTYGWNSFHTTLECCGVDSYKDWFGTNFDNTTGILIVRKPIKQFTTLATHTVILPD